MTENLSTAELLRAIVAIAAEERSLRDVLKRSAKLVVRATGADACFVHVVDHDRSEVVLMGAEPESFDALAGQIRLRLGEGLAGWVALHGESAVVADKWSDPRYRYIPALKGEDYKSLVSTPLLRPGRGPVGVINVHAHDADHFVEDVLARLAEVADLLAGIVEAAVLHEQLRSREEQLERFAEATIEMQEAERRRFASDIHDGISQRLISAWYHLRAARQVTLDPTVVGELEEAEKLLSGALDEARVAISGLRPTVLDDLGLVSALESLAASAKGFDVELELESCQLAPHLEMCVYRVVQEALQNAQKHSKASRICLRMHSAPEGLEVTVSDDGVGFEPSRPRHQESYGLPGMAERAALVGGSLSVDSAPGAGTKVSLKLPLPGRPAASPPA